MWWLPVPSLIVLAPGPACLILFPKAAVSNFSHIKGVYYIKCCTTKEVVVEREEEEMKRPGHSWPSQARLIYPWLTLRALVTHFMDTLWCCTHLALFFKTDISMCSWIYLSEKLITSLGAHGNSMDLQKLHYWEKKKKIKHNLSKWKTKCEQERSLCFWDTKKGKKAMIKKSYK